MKRRQFFTRLAAGIAGMAVAPKIAAEILKTDERIDFLKQQDTPEEYFPGNRSSYNDRCFFGKKICWDNKGEITCIIDHGPVPMINDIVMLNLLDDHHLPIMAIVISIDKESNDVKNIEPHVLSMITLDRDDAERMADLVNSRDVMVWQAGPSNYPQEWTMGLLNEDAFMGICTASAFAEPYKGQPGVFRYVDPQRPGHMNIDWDHLEKYCLNATFGIKNFQMLS